MSLLLVVLVTRAAGGESPEGRLDRVPLHRPDSLASDAPAALLLHRGELHLMDREHGETASILAVEVRLRLLSAAGCERYRRLELHSGPEARLVHFSGSTILPRGREVPVGEDALFFDPRQSQVTIVFPAVEVGATLHYRYEVRFESSYYQSPWLFDSRLPTERSEMTYWIPRSLETRSWERIAPGLRLERQVQKTERGTRLALWMEDLPALPAEPYGPTLVERASQHALLVTGGLELGSAGAKLESWLDIRQAAELQYRQARSHRREVRARARELSLAAGAGATPESKARHLYRFVRDELVTDGPGEVFLPPRSGGLDAVLQSGRASPAEKALLLQVMLQEIDIPSSLVWAADARRRQIDFEHPNPLWLKRVLLRTEISGRQAFLDPSDPRLAFARLTPGTEGTEAWVLGRRRLERVTLPASQAADNRRRMEIELTLGADGLWRGSGRATLTGLAAWSAPVPQEHPESGVEGSSDRGTSFWGSIPAAWEEFEITELELQRTYEEQELFLRWKMQQRPEPATSGVSFLRLGQRWRPRIDPALLTLQRRTPVHLPFPFEDSVEILLHWPAEWELRTLPADVEHRGQVGGMTRHAHLETKAGELQLVTRLALRRREVDLAAYPELRSLLALEKEDDWIVLLPQH